MKKLLYVVIAAAVVAFALKVSNGAQAAPKLTLQWVVACKYSTLLTPDNETKPGWFVFSGYKAGDQNCILMFRLGKGSASSAKPGIDPTPGPRIDPDPDPTKPAIVPTHEWIGPPSQTPMPPPCVGC